MSPRTPVPVKKYVIRRSTEPSERWNEVVKDHEEHLADLARFLDGALITEFGWFIGGYVVPFFFWSLSCLLWVFSNTYIDELKGIAKISTKHGLTFSKLIAFNYGYDFLAYCTSAAVSEYHSGTGEGANRMWHLRNMDWDGDILRKLTIDVEFKGSNSETYTITTWVGMVGALTGMNSERSVSLNFRKTHHSVLWAPWNFVRRTWSMIFDSPVGFLIRYYLSDSAESRPNFNSPCYITECKHSYGGCSLVGYGIEDSFMYSWFLDRKLVVVTNVDPNVHTIDKEWAAGDPLLLSAVDRRTKAEEELIKLENPITPDKLFTIMQIDPIYNDQTIYTTIMCPATGYYSTVVYQ